MNILSAVNTHVDECLTIPLCHLGKWMREAMQLPNISSLFLISPCLSLQALCRGGALCSIGARTWLHVPPASLHCHAPSWGRCYTVTCRCTETDVNRPAARTLLFIYSLFESANSHRIKNQLFALTYLSITHEEALRLWCDCVCCTTTLYWMNRQIRRF